MKRDIDFEKIEEREAIASALNDDFKSLSDEDIMKICKAWSEMLIRNHYEDFMKE